MNKTLSDQLDKKANGADQVDLNGKKYVRRGPKNSVSDPGPWREVKESMDLIKELLNISAEASKLNEAAYAYKDSGEFTDDLTTVFGKIHDIVTIIDSRRWKEWMSITDKNFGSKCVDANQKMHDLFKKFEAAYHKLDEALDKAV